MNKADLPIGIVGVGLMGHGIARSIQQHGYSISLLEHAGNQPLDDLLEKGAELVQTPADLAAASEIIIICVTGSPEVEQVVFAEDGILQGIQPGNIVIDCSTAIPASTLKVYQALSEAGARYIDAPMTRTPREAEEGRLNLIVGGDPVLFDSLLPLLQCFAENITLAGAVGSGHQMKLLHNFVSLGFSALLAEATASARRAGIEDEVLIEVLAKGGGGGVILQRLAPYIQQGDDSGFRFSIANAAKDMGYYQEMLASMDFDGSIANVVNDLYQRALADTPAQTPVPRLLDFLSQ
ncbi:MAG: NAD(P)-dependent oxidoreductase [Gammaproteobacteria bacterium]|nr:NAD(P)-dependent oxidoreductase [Gammaproteobacteria bacterium]